ncbi:MAG: hypothetical protein RMJ51_04220 [Candidatus Calescibacterium sp.]|nr:hypothetical protein [Candidatus Calescibacterium sp.]MCX7972778.1 hypothetical protein [bacterium]MDW8195426.1 hypothetical protein [Candidatus Calescibacterium sp.]
MNFEKEFESIESDLVCPRCGGLVVETSDLEMIFFYEHIREYSCVICGHRFWIDLEEIMTTISMIKNKEN